MRLTWLSPGDPDQRTGGYLWNARIVSALRAAGHEVTVLALPGAWPRPGLSDPNGVALDAIPDRERVVADGLCWPGLGDAGARLAERCPVTAIVHSLAARETGVADPAEVDRWERASWRACRGLVATSRLTAGQIGGPAAVVIPGTSPAPRARGSSGRRVLTVGTLTRRKGHDRLFAALRGLECEIRCAGSDRDPEWARSLRELARGLDVAWLGELDDGRLAAEYDAADLVVQAAHYEAFGMGVAEAVARGLPVVTTPAGVVDHLPPDAVRAVEPEGLRDAVRELLTDRSARRDLADAAWRARESLPDWPAQAERLVEALQ